MPVSRQRTCNVIQRLLHRNRRNALIYHSIILRGPDLQQHDSVAEESTCQRFLVRGLGFAEENCYIEFAYRMLILSKIGALWRHEW